jgi:hypothetical protein
MNVESMLASKKFNIKYFGKAFYNLNIQKVNFCQHENFQLIFPFD